VHSKANINQLSLIHDIEIKAKITKNNQKLTSKVPLKKVTDPER